MQADKPLQFRIDGMDCMEEVSLLRDGLSTLVGGEHRLGFDVLSRKMTVQATDTSITVDGIVEAVRKLGMHAVPLVDNEAMASQLENAGWRKSLWLTSLCGFALLAGFAIQIGAYQGWIGSQFASNLERVCFGLAVAAGFWIVVPKARLRAARHLQPDMNLLMTVAVGGAIFIGEFAEAASVAFLFSLSHVLEAWSVRRAQRAISALLDLSPPTARLLDSSGEQEKPIEQIPLGSRILVKPGERVPLDGTVVAGESDLNQAPITGESMPVAKAIGADVFAGSINGNGALEVQTTKTAGNSTIANIIRLIDQARSQRSNSEQWVDRFSKVYTPLVMLVALLVFVVPPLLTGASWMDWLYRSLVLLVIACPCALVISTPVAVVAALAAAASAGVLVKGGSVLEAMSGLKAVAVDKTGTLTEGKPAVKSILPMAIHDEQELVARAAALDSRSDHPLARAILDEATRQNIALQPADNYQEIPGKGASGRWQGRLFWIGSTRLMNERGQASPEVNEKIKSLTDQGQTVVVVGNEEHICGIFGLADSVRESSRSALNELKSLGIEHIQMLTGDSIATANSIAQGLAIDAVSANLLPADKVTAIQSLVTRYKYVAMVGDGVNDAPALAMATVGIAMGVAGSDAAIETADVALMSNNLTKLPWLVRHSRRMLGIIQQNIAFSLGVKALFVVLTCLGLSTLWGAIAADTGASLLVIFNGLRLLRE